MDESDSRWTLGGPALFRGQPRKTHRKWDLRPIRLGTHPPATRREAIADQRPDRLPSVGVANFLSFHRRPRIVGDRNFRDLFPHAAQLRGHFWAEFKTAALQPYPRQQRPAHDFVAGGFVVNAREIKKIGKMRQQLCAKKKPKSALRTI